MSAKILLGLGLAAVVSLAATSSFAACSEPQEKAAGRKIADAAKSELSDTAGRQSARLIKITSCNAVDGVVSASFTYNFVSEDRAYAVDGTAQIVDGQVTSVSLRRPNRVFASIDTYYSEN